MMQRLLRISLLLCVPLLVFANEPVQVDISGDQLLTGEADEGLRALGSQAARQGRQLVVSAPDYWQDQVVEQLRRGAEGAELSIDVRDVFVESIIVRLLGDSERPAEIPGRVSAVEPEPEPTAVAPRPRTEVEIERPQSPVVSQPLPQRSADIPDTASVASELRQQATTTNLPLPRQAEPASGQTPSRSAPEPVPAQPVVQQAPVEREIPPQPVPAAPEPEPVAVPTPVQTAPAPVAAAPVAATPEPIASTEPDAAAEEQANRRLLEQNLNSGNAITSQLTPGELDVGDLVYVVGDTRAVVRRVRQRPTAFWLVGDLDPNRPELTEQQAGRYRVTQRLREDLANVEIGPLLFEAGDPDADPESRELFERRYNQGRSISGTLTPGDLRAGDLMYTGSSIAVVVRRDRGGLVRFWFVGSVDLRGDAFIEEATNRWRVVRTPG